MQAKKVSDNYRNTFYDIVYWLWNNFIQQNEWRPISQIYKNIDNSEEKVSMFVKVKLGKKLLKGLESVGVTSHELTDILKWQ